MAGKPRKQTVLEVQVIVDADAPEMARTLQFVMTSLKGANRNLNKDVAAVVVSIFDEDGVFVGGDTTGTPSEAALEIQRGILDDAVEVTPTQT